MEEWEEARGITEELGALVEENEKHRGQQEEGDVVCVTQFCVLMDDSTAMYPTASPQHHHSKVRRSRHEDRFDHTYESVCVLHRTDLVFLPLCVSCMNKRKAVYSVSLHV